MATSVSRASNNKIGTCPHGLPLGACPICNGMGGGGGVRRDTKPKEMSYEECFAVWQVMKAQKAARANTQKLFAAQDLAAYLNKIQTQITNMKLAILNSALPKPIAKAVAVVADAVLMPAVKLVQTITNTLQNIAVAVTKATNNLKQAVADIMDKLTAVFGEAKAAIQKKIDEKIKDVKKKILGFFGITSTENEEDEEVKRLEEERMLEDEQKIFELELKKSQISEQEKDSEN